MRSKFELTNQEGLTTVLKLPYISTSELLNSGKICINYIILLTVVLQSHEWHVIHTKKATEKIFFLCSINEASVKSWLP